MRAAVADGQWWRIATASIVHLSAMHLAMNVAALAAILAAWGRGRLRAGGWIVLALSLAQWPAAWWLAPGLAWGAGLSGALHGLVACWATQDALDGSAPTAWRRFGGIALAGLALKLGAEAAWPPGDATLPVAAELHWIGAGLGVALAIATTLGRSVAGRDPRPVRSGAAPCRRR